MTLNCIYWQTEEAQASEFLPILKVLYLCGFHGNPTFCTITFETSLFLETI